MGADFFDNYAREDEQELLAELDELDNECLAEELCDAGLSLP